MSSYSSARNPGEARRNAGLWRWLAASAVTCLLLSSAVGCGAGWSARTDGEGHESAAAPRFGWVVRDGDEFAGCGLDSDRWRVYDGPGHGGVGVRSPSAVEVDDGFLAIRGRGDVSGGIAWRAGKPTTYGRWEIRARSDMGIGYAPAILLWPDSDRWPEDGEIDIVEITAGDRSSMITTVHYGVDNQQLSKEIAGDFSQWHVFAVEWTPYRITVFLDGQPVFTTRNPAAIPHWPMHLAIQNDVGPYQDWIPARDTSTPDVVGLYVDWVRLYY